MKLSDLDLVTKRVICAAHIVVDFPEALGRLDRALKDFDQQHRAEMNANLLEALFPKRHPRKKISKRKAQK